MSSSRGFVEVPENAETLPDCYCSHCGMARARNSGKYSPFDLFGGWALINESGYACHKCGNKRCPHHEWHGFKCTDSNDKGQQGELVDEQNK